MTMEDFDNLVHGKLEAIRESEDSAGEMRRMQSLVTNWADSVRHFDSAAGLPGAQQNRNLAMTYLERLRELLQDDRDQTGQSLSEAEPQPGGGPPQEGEPQPGEADEPQDGEDPGENAPRESGGEGDQTDAPRDGGNDDSSESDGPGRKPDEQEKTGEQEVDPNESPEDRARRILGENADLETGPPTPGRHEFNPPEKDW
jgi:hypothetical protein